MDEEPKRHSRQRAVIARSVGIIAIALGFVSGMHGLDHPDSIWLRTALGLIATGMMAQGYALYCTLRRMREKQDSNTP
jgi:Kef-type K+ transport system membrane component KefB